MSSETNYSGSLRAKVGVRLTGRETERMIKLCGLGGIELRRLQREENGKGYRFVMWADEFFSLRPYLKKTKCRARIISKKGVPFYLKRQKRRWLFPAGFLLGAGLLFFLAQFIWKIDIEGNVSCTDDVMYRFLDEQNIRFGTAKAAVYGAELEELIRNQFSEVTWVSVELEGTHMTVHIKEDDQLAAEVPETEAAHVMSSADGVITSIVVRAGQTSLREGDLITAGQILISGDVELKDDGGNITGTRQVHADGEVYARISYEYQDKFLLSHEIREYEPEPAVGYHLVLGRTHVPLPRFGELGDYYDMVTERNQLYLGSDYYLPVYLEKTHYRSYLRRVEDYSEEEALAEAERRMNQYLAKLEADGKEIVTKEFSLQIEKGICRVTGSYEAVSQVGVSQAISENVTDILQ